VLCISFIDKEMTFDELTEINFEQFNLHGRYDLA
jgi:hypothetical protein